MLLHDKVCFHSLEGWSTLDTHESLASGLNSLGKSEVAISFALDAPLCERDEEHLKLCPALVKKQMRPPVMHAQQWKQPHP